MLTSANASSSLPLPSNGTQGLHQGVLPIQHFPRDVLAEIFLFCLPGGPPSKWAAPLLLCNICSSWRSLALSTPRLWATLELVPPFVGEKTVIACIHTWFSRAGTLPLTIKFNFTSRTVQGTSSFDISRILNTLSQYMSRWESFDISVRGPVSHSQETWEGSMEAPFLRTFQVGGNNLGIPFSSAPRLKAVVLNQFESLPTAIQSIPWHQLTTLTIPSGPSLRAALEFMRYCSTLERLSIYVECDREDEDESHPPCKPRIEMANLHAFYLDSLRDVRPILQSLVLPELVVLSLEYHFHFAYDDDDKMTAASYGNELIDLFSYSKCKLQRLALGNCNLTPNQIIRLLHHGSLATLTSLSIENYRNVRIFDDDAFVHLSASKESPEMLALPHLAGLTLEMCIDPNISPGFLGRMVWSRCNGNGEKQSLKSFLATTLIRLQESDKALLREVEALGIRVDLYIRDEDGDENADTLEPCDDEEVEHSNKVDDLD